VTRQQQQQQQQSFNGPLSGTTRLSQYQNGKINLDFTEARDSEWQCQLRHMQVCTSLQTDNHASTPSPSFLQAGCPSFRPKNNVKALSYLVLSCLVGSRLLRLSKNCLVLSCLVLQVLGLYGLIIALIMSAKS